MRIGIIDLGTNSLRLDVHQISPRGDFKNIYREKFMVRLGQDVFLTRCLNPQAKQRTIQGIEIMCAVAQKLRVNKITAFGTSALREARDSQSFLNSVRRKLGIEIKVISGSEEARLIALGILSNEKKAGNPFAFVDIGGGSTEIGICKNGNLDFSVSLSLGSARLQQLFLRRIPPRPESIAQLRSHVKSILENSCPKARIGKIKNVLGSSGTIKAISRLVHKDDSLRPFTLKQLILLNERLSVMSTAELLSVPGMEAKRVDILLSGSLLFEEVMRFLEVRVARFTDFSLRDGIIAEEISLFKKRGSSRISFHLDELVDRAERLGGHPKVLRSILAFGDALFEKTKPLHRLSSNWKPYLLASIVLRKIGEPVSFQHQEEMTSFMIENGDWPGFEAWEQVFVAQLCAQHNRERRRGWKKISGLELKKKTQGEILDKLISLLWIVDSLDLGTSEPIRIKRFQVNRGKCQLVLRHQGTSGLGVLRLQSRKQSIEQFLGKELQVVFQS